MNKHPFFVILSYFVMWIKGATTHSVDISYPRRVATASSWCQAEPRKTEQLSELTWKQSQSRTQLLADILWTDHLVLYSTVLYCTMSDTTSCSSTLDRSPCLWESAPTSQSPLCIHPPPGFCQSGKSHAACLSTSILYREQWQHSVYLLTSPLTVLTMILYH